MPPLERAQFILAQLSSSESRIRWVVLGSLYFLGILYWMHSFGVFSTGADGNALAPEFGYLDWPRNLQIIEVIKDAVQRFELPYVSSMLLFETNQLIAVPEVPITPQQVLLAFISADSYILLNPLLMYTIGFVWVIVGKAFEALCVDLSIVVRAVYVQWPRDISSGDRAHHVGCVLFAAVPDVSGFPNG